MSTDLARLDDSIRALSGDVRTIADEVRDLQRTEDVRAGAARERAQLDDRLRSLPHEVDTLAERVESMAAAVTALTAAIEAQGSDSTWAAWAQSWRPIALVIALGVAGGAITAADGLELLTGASASPAHDEVSP